MAHFSLLTKPERSRPVMPESALGVAVFSLEKLPVKAHSEAMKSELKPTWTREDILALGRSYQGAVLLTAAADLNLFSVTIWRRHEARESTERR
jgi:hypothetical protein